MRNHREDEEANELESDTNSDSGIESHDSANPDDDTSSVKDGDEEKDKVQPCPNCGKVHPNVLFQPTPFGLLVKFKLVPKENKDEGKDEEKERRSGVRAIKWSKCKCEIIVVFNVSDIIFHSI